MYNSQIICFEHLYKAHIQHINIYPIIGVHKVRYRNPSLNHSRNPPIPTKFYQSTSFYIPYMMPIKKPPNESRTKNALQGQSPTRVAARMKRRAKPRPRAGSHPCAVLTQKRGFSPLNSKSDHFQSKPSLYNIPTPSITFYNI